MKQLAGGLKEVKDVKAVTGMLSKTFGGKSDVKDVLGAVTVSSSDLQYTNYVYQEAATKRHFLRLVEFLQKIQRQD